MTTLTNDQITAGAAVLGDNGQPIGRNAAIAVFDAMRAASPQVADIADVAKFKQAFHEASRVGAGYDEAVAVGLAASRRAAPRDVCAEMRALCSACGGTGDVVSLDGEWRGTCDCEASRAPASAGQAAPAQLGIGFANNDQGVHVSVMQSLPDGKLTVIHQAKVPAGDSFTRVTLAAPTERAAAPAEQPSAQKGGA